MKNNIKYFFLFIFFFLFAACRFNKEVEKYEDSRFLFGTYIKIIVYDNDIEKAKKSIEKAFNEIARIDEKFNSKFEGSLIYNLNTGKQKEVILDDEGKEIFSKVKEVYELSDRKYDITITPLMKLWGFTEENIDSLKLKIPTKEEIEFTKMFVDFSKVKIEDNKLYLEEPIKEMDTGSFLKGYAVHKAKEVLKENGIKSAFITSISSIDLIGGKPNNKVWKIGLQNPKNISKTLGVLSLKDKAMGVSGDYQTYVEIDGEIYHHILDKETGYPIQDKKMVVVVADNAFDADLYSTSFFLMPIDKVLNFVESRKDLEVMIVDKDMQIIKSKNFEYEERSE